MPTGAKVMPTKKFVFRKHANIGSADAIEDRRFLEESFVDNGALDLLTDTSNPTCILLGRTGSGKTALIEQIHSTKDKVIRINPEGLALTYISSSETLKFFSEAGVELDLFYRLLWRHVFAVEIIRQHYNIVSEQRQLSFFEQIARIFERDKSKRDAIEYLKAFGEKFWLESEHRVKEITQTVERDLAASINGDSQSLIASLGKLGLTLSAAKKLTEEQKTEIVQRGQNVVNQVQMKTLSKVMEILEKDILEDKQEKYYITVDRLDENWVHDEFRYGLIKALLDSVRDFNNNIRNVKIIVAIREDLLDRVFRHTRDPGHQEEKYRSMYLSLTWTKSELEVLLDKRVNQLIREQYTTQTVKLKDVFPEVINKRDSLQYFFERTMLRPRDAILYFNECIKASEGTARFTQTSVVDAEAHYSENRLRALADEWAADYPNLIESCIFLKKTNPRFKLSEALDEWESAALKFSVAKYSPDHISKIVEDSLNNVEDLAFQLVKIFYRVGLIGVKTESFKAFQWSFLEQKLIATDISTNTSIQIHPAFWRVLGTNNTDHRVGVDL